MIELEGFRFRKLKMQDDGTLIATGCYKNAIRLQVEVEFDKLVDMCKQAGETTTMRFLSEHWFTIWLRDGKLVRASSWPHRRQLRRRAQKESPRLKPTSSFPYDCTRTGVSEFLEDEQTWINTGERAFLRLVCSDFMMPAEAEQLTERGTSAFVRFYNAVVQRKTVTLN